MKIHFAFVALALTACDPFSFWKPHELTGERLKDLYAPRELPRPRGMIVSHGYAFGGRDAAFAYRVQADRQEISRFANALRDYLEREGFTIKERDRPEEHALFPDIRDKLKWWTPGTLSHPKTFDMSRGYDRGYWVSYSEEDGILYLLYWST